MGKKSKTKAEAPPAVAVNLPKDADPETVAKRAAELKEQGNQAFAKNEFDVAVQAYDAAISCFSEPKDKAACYNNKAACYIKKQKYNDAVKECTAALGLVPDWDKARMRRARAYELMARNDLAMTDCQELMKKAGGKPSQELKDMDERIKNNIMQQVLKLQQQHQAQQAANGGKGHRQAQAAAAAPAAPKPRPAPPAVSIKLVHGDDIRLTQVPAAATYADVLLAAKNKFTEIGPFALKYKDRDGDLITITSQADLVAAAAAAASGAGAGPALPPKPGAAVPPLKVHVQKVADASLIPAPPAAEVKAMSSARAAAARAARGEEGPDELELDDWMFDFAHLFRTQLGIDWDGYVDLHNEGMEKCNAALEDAMKTEEALPLFEQSAAKFQEVAALALFNWGNVHMCCARRLESRSEKGGALPVKEMEAEYAKAEERYKASLDVKADFYESAIAWGQEMFEHAKLLATQEDQRREAKGGAVDLKVHKAIEALYAQAQAKFEGALLMIPEDESAPDGMAAADQEAQVEEAQNAEAVRAQVVVMWGNVLFELSQMKAQRGEDYQATLDEAVAKFNDAGCSEEDINNALDGHWGNKDKPKASKPAAKEEAKEGDVKAAKFDPLGGGEAGKKKKKKPPTN